MRLYGLGIAIAVVIAAVAWDLRDTPLAISAIAKLTGRPIPQSTTETRSLCQGGPLVPVAGTLRNDGAGWYALADADHVPMNVKSVTSTLQAVRVAFTFKARQVVTFVATPDEALARVGLFAGASVGLDVADIALARRGITGTFQRSPAAITTQTYPLSNLWFYGLFVADVACG